MKEPTKDDQEKNKRKAVIEIREMEIDDLAAVFHLGERLYSSKDTPNLYRTWDEFEVTGMFQEEPEFCLVADAEDRIVGFVMGTTITKTHSAWKYGHLIWLGVDPQYQRFGVATRLFNHFRELMLADGVRIMLVDTEADNFGALKFFHRLGFGNIEEHVYMSLNLDAQIKQIKDKKTKNHNHNHD
jgi:ribosomal protein S18 acetylase RimI-like enzyme